MSETASTVNITFQSPARAHQSRPSVRHSRDLEGVPASTARKMARDFTKYQTEPSAINEKKLYEYQPTGRSDNPDREVVVALDFGEIVTLEVNQNQGTLSRAVA